MIPSILQGTKRIAGAGNELNNLADSYDIQERNARAAGFNPVAEPARRQPAFRTQDLILGLLPALLGGGQQYVADYLKGKFGAADQLTQEDQAKAQQQQRMQMGMADLQGDFYANKAKQIRQGQDRSANLYQHQQDQAFQKSILEDKQAAAIEAARLKGNVTDRQRYEMFDKAYKGIQDTKTGRLNPTNFKAAMIHAKAYADSTGDLKPYQHMLDIESELGPKFQEQDENDATLRELDTARKELANKLSDKKLTQIDAQITKVQNEASRIALESEWIPKRYRAKVALDVARAKDIPIRSGIAQQNANRVGGGKTDGLKELRYQLSKDTSERVAAVSAASIAKKMMDERRGTGANMKSEAAMANDLEYQEARKMFKDAMLRVNSIAMKQVPKAETSVKDTPRQSGVVGIDPKSVAQASAHEAAKKAIAAGASKAAVNARLKKNGYAPLP